MRRVYLLHPHDPEGGYCISHKFLRARVEELTLEKSKNNYEGSLLCDVLVLVLESLNLGRTTMLLCTR